MNSGKQRKTGHTRLGMSHSAQYGEGDMFALGLSIIRNAMN
jgi:hypothetical protein